MPITYLEFKLLKEMAYQDTFGKDKQIRKEYDKYIKEENYRYNKISKCIIKKRNTRKMCESK